MVARLRAWLTDRLAIDPKTTQALNKGVPKGVGWLNTLGSASLALFLLLGVTGIVLAMFYSPHPAGAHESIEYLDHQVPGGHFVHSLHYHGESVFIVVLGLHLLRIFIQGTYKKPHELTWLFGIILLNLVLVFGVTGALLPWDQKAYHGTVVRTTYPGDVPLIGPMARELLLGGGSVGVLSLTRFFALHTLLLPALFVPLLWLHMRNAWRKGASPPAAPVDAPVANTSRFLDHHLARHLVAMLLAVGVVMVMAVMDPVHPEFKANPSDVFYHAKSEWYFLWIMQLVKDIPWMPSWIVALGIPGLAFTFLAVAPWIDRNNWRAPAKRPLMVTALALGILGVSLMTVRAFSLMPRNATPQDSLAAQFTDKGEKPLELAEVKAGKEAFQQCGGCHKAYSYSTGTVGPDLTGYGRRNFLMELDGHPEIEKLSFYDRYAGYVRGTLRPSRTIMQKYSAEMLPQEKLDAIGAFLSQDPRHPLAR